MAAVSHDPRLGSFSIDGKARVAPNVEVTLEATTATSQNTDVSFDGLPAFDTYHSTSYRAGVAADTKLGLIAVNAWRNWFGTTSATVFNAPLEVPVANTVTVLQASDTLQLNASHIVRIKLEYRDNTATSAAVFGGTIGYADYAVSGMWDWRITPDLSFTNSLRIDHLATRYDGTLLPGDPFSNAEYNHTSIVQPSFNSGLVYKVTGLDTVRLTAGRGLQAPSLIDFGVEYPANPASARPEVIGSPMLRPTAVWNLELGYDREVPAIASTIRGAVFAQRNDDLLAPGSATLPGLLPTGVVAAVTQNIGASDAAGAEAGIAGHSASGFRWNASFAFMGTVDHTSINKVFLTSSQNYQDGTPASVVVLGGGYTWERLETDLAARWQSRYTDYRLSETGLVPVVVSNYLTLTGRVGYNLTEHLTLALAAQQFNTSRLVESAGPPVERSVIASVTVHF
jgi:iron complex outermembrane receptor protein